MVLVWQPITDLPQDWSALTDGELGPLLQFWNDQRADLEQSGALSKFSERLAREWSIETGQIEGVYNLDRGVTETLIEHGINADLIGSQPGQKPPELIAAIIQDHQEVLEGLFPFVKDERPISKSYIHELHAALLRHQDTSMMVDQFGNLFESKLLKGKYKQRPNNPKKPDGTMHQYCPPEQVDSEMERLLALHAEHGKQGIPVEIEAVWLHHRFAQIHPYQDGNGRVARALASLVFIRAGWFPVVVAREDRPRYIDALEVADEDDLSLLISFFTDMQKRALFQATQVATDVQQIETVEEAIAAAKRVLVGAGQGLDPSVWSKTKATADHLLQITDQRLYDLSYSLRNEIGSKREEYQFSTVFSSPSVTITTPYKPNVAAYEQSRSLIIAAHRVAAQQTVYLTIRAHAIGAKSRGLIAMIPLFIQNDSAQIVSKDIFQVNYAEPYESAERRFRPWLEESLVNALTMWRKSL